MTVATTSVLEELPEISVPRLEPTTTLPVVATASDAASVMVEEPTGFLRAFVRGSIIGAVVLFVFGAGTALFAGGAGIDALGLGAFCAFWGGPGFGGAIGASIHKGPDDHR
jgi:hypothetical protein